MMCTKKYPRNADLRKHMEKAHGIDRKTNPVGKPTCAECGTCFTSNHTFKRHMLVHIKEDNDDNNPHQSSKVELESVT